MADNVRYKIIEINLIQISLNLFTVKLLEYVLDVYNIYHLKQKYHVLTASCNDNDIKDFQKSGKYIVQIFLKQLNYSRVCKYNFITAVHRNLDVLSNKQFSSYQPTIL